MHSFNAQPVFTQPLSLLLLLLHLLLLLLLLLLLVLLLQCGRAVTHLSGLLESSVVVDGFINEEEDLHMPLSRQQFEDICKPLKASLRV